MKKKRLPEFELPGSSLTSDDLAITIATADFTTISQFSDANLRKNNAQKL